MKKRITKQLQPKGGTGHHEPPARRAYRTIRAGLLALMVLLLGVVTAAAHHDERDHGRKIAPDLAQMMEKLSPAESVRLVVVLENRGGQEVADNLQKLGGRVRRALRNVRQIALDLPLGQVEELSAVDGVRYVAPDRKVQGFSSHLQTTTGASNTYPGAWENNLDLIFNEYGLGYDGTGVGVAVIDSGIEDRHADLRDDGGRVVHERDFVDGGGSDDLFGHGSHVAGIVAGSGDAAKQKGYDLAGIAPGAHLIDLRVLDEYGRGNMSDVIAAVDYAIAQRDALGIRILNLSLAAPPVESYRQDPLCQAIARAVQQGLVVVAAAGNFGINNSGDKVYGGIPSPGISPAAITVGATDTRGTDVRSDDLIAPFSSRGPTRSGSVDPATGGYVYDNLPKPDLVAPGLGIVSLESPGSTLISNYPALDFDTGKGNQRNGYMTLSGTSMAAGVVSGAAALMLEANPSLGPNQIRAILMYSAQIMDGPDLFEQGAGMLNIDGAVRLARRMSREAGSLDPGDPLIDGDMPDPTSSVAGESLAWSQGLIWTNWRMYGQALMTEQQEAYSQGLIWTYSFWRYFGAGVAAYDGLYSDDHVVYGSNGGWQGVVWDQGTTHESGLLYYDDLAAMGAYWENREITDDFFTVDASGLIWSYFRSMGQGLIWTYGGFWPIAYSGLIWTLYF
jgi:subtilisin family serine protease